MKIARLVFLISTSFYANHAWTCQVSKLVGTNSKVIINSSEGRVFSDLSTDGISISRCSSETNKIILSKNTVFQYLDSKAQSVNSLSELNISRRCEVQSDIDSFKTTADKIKEITQINVEEDYKLLNQCVLMEVTSPFKREIKVIDSNDCSIVSKSNSSNQVILKGNRCVLDYSANETYNIRFKISPDCLNQNFLKSNEARDVMSQFIVHPASVDKTRSQAAGQEVVMGDPSGPSLSRQIVFKFLPDSNSFPMVNDEVTKIKYPSVLNYNFHQGQITLRQIGTKTKFDMEYLTENISKAFCKDGYCTKGSNSFNPVMIRMNVFRQNGNKFEMLNSAPWHSPIVVPKNWVGKLDATDLSLFLGRVSSAYYISKSLKKGDRLKFVTEFLDAKLILENLMLEADVNSEFNDDITVDGYGYLTLPKLPQFGVPKLSLKLVALPSISGDPDSLKKDLENFGVDMNSVFTHSYNKICTAENRCASVVQGKAFQKIETYFDIGDAEYGVVNLENIKTLNTSLTNGHYEAELKQFPKIVCD